MSAVHLPSTVVENDVRRGSDAAQNDARFTLDGDTALERQLARTCARVLSGVRGLVPPKKLQALLLGGGYGRGEGGVWRDVADDRPYNDLEFYVAIRGNRHLNEKLYGRSLEVLGQILTHLADVEVEFKITSLEELQQQSVSMFSYDLLAGHRLLWGSRRDLTSCAHHLNPAEIPLAEATRLLMNRGSGLLFSRVKLANEALPPSEADFIRRNIAKASLACGDAVLVAHQRYHWSCRERHRRLDALMRESRLPWRHALLRLHAKGVEFKLHPVVEPLPRVELAASYAEVVEVMRGVWFWLESQRLGVTFDSAKNYALGGIDKCPELPRWRSALINFRRDRHRVLVRGELTRHPRQRLFHALALLLWEPTVTSEKVLLSALQSELDTRATSFRECMGAYERLWQRVR